MTALYQIANLTKIYGERMILQLEALAIQRGEIFALIGPSGAGKSTLLRLLGLIEFASAGSLEFMGSNYGRQVPLAVRRQVTLMFQQPLLLDGSVRRNVEYGLRVRGQRNPVAVEWAIAQVGLEDLVDSASSTLSGGERQRVALARALVFQPDVLLLDEPTAHLDPQNVAIIEAVLRYLNKEQGTSIILATHNLFQARRLNARVAMLLDGQIIEVSSADELLDNPQDPRTLAFVQGGMPF